MSAASSAPVAVDTEARVPSSLASADASAPSPSPSPVNPTPLSPSPSSPLSSSVRILPWDPQYRLQFRDLNLAWVENLFSVEPMDRLALEQPEETFIRPGGTILLAQQVGDAEAEGGSVDGSSAAGPRFKDGDIIGTVALLYEGAGRFELCKMCVAEGLQGRGVGRAMLKAALQHFHAVGGSYLYLESNSKLVNALHLYESVGFRHTPKPPSDQPVHYSRADVYMVYQPSLRGGGSDVSVPATQ